MFSRNLSVPDFVRRFFVSCAQISEAYAVRTVIDVYKRQIECLLYMEEPFLLYWICYIKNAVVKYNPPPT